ncbi:MAG: hypothetical protein AAGD47_04565 [Pseudomonadota bacterium]
MRKIFLLAACLATAACAPGVVKRQKAESKEYAELRDADCYTVDLFDEVDIEPPAPNVPENIRAFLGDWGYGAWNGTWCHDMLIYKVTPAGEVTLMDMHAPNFSLNQPPTVFRRTGYVDLNGTLRFAYGKERRVYRIDRQFLVGSRTGNLGEFRIAMTRKDIVPAPINRPLKLVSN